MKTLHHNDSGILVEECQQININDFVAQSKQKLKYQFIQLLVEVEDSSIALTTSKLLHGGIRYWFLCPFCNSRVGKLYKHPVNQMLACRKCHNLEYRCRRYKGMIEMKNN